MKREKKNDKQYVYNFACYSFFSLSLFRCVAWNRHSTFIFYIAFPMCVLTDIDVNESNAKQIGKRNRLANNFVYQDEKKISHKINDEHLKTMLDSIIHLCVNCGVQRKYGTFDCVTYSQVHFVICLEFFHAMLFATQQPHVHRLWSLTSPILPAATTPLLTCSVWNRVLHSLHRFNVKCQLGYLFFLLLLLLRMGPTHLLSFVAHIIFHLQVARAVRIYEGEQMNKRIFRHSNKIPNKTHYIYIYTFLHSYCCCCLICHVRTFSVFRNITNDTCLFRYMNECTWKHAILPNVTVYFECVTIFGSGVLNIRSQFDNSRKEITNWKVSDEKL